jgi:thymidylate synthase (FAD)
MNIVKPYVEVDEYDLGSSEQGIRMLRKIERIARISHRSEEAQTETSWDKFLRAVVLSHGDWSVTEHASISVEFYVDRGITHEIVRHRLASYTQESTRFVNYEKKMPPSFLYPKTWDAPEWGVDGVRTDTAVKDDECRDKFFQQFDKDWLNCISVVEDTYKKLIAKGWKPQEARSILPNALGSKIVMTCNLRNWRHFLLMRTTRETHPQCREVTIPLLKIFQERIPIFYEDIEPMGSQVDAIAKGR